MIKFELHVSLFLSIGKIVAKKKKNVVVEIIICHIL
jgi:hypothetical protein